MLEGRMGVLLLDLALTEFVVRLALPTPACDAQAACKLLLFRSIAPGSSKLP
jgi:hypothetical protein